jgi:hypothetical protein
MLTNIQSPEADVNQLAEKLGRQIIYVGLEHLGRAAGSKDTIDFFPNSLARYPSFFEQISHLPVRFFGSREEYGLIIEGFKKWFGKVNAYKQISKCCPDSLSHVVGICDLSGLENKLLKLSEDNLPYVVKPEYGCGGRNACLIQSKESISSYCLWTKSDVFEKTLEIRKNDQFIIEKKISWEHSPSASGFISDNSVYFVGIWDQYVDDLKFTGARYPSETNHSDGIKDITMAIGLQLQADHYRGPYNLDFLETDATLLVSDLNLRYGYSHCYAQYAKDEGIRFWELTNTSNNLASEKNISKTYAVLDKSRIIKFEGGN